MFQLTPPSAAGGSWTETVIHNFGRVDGRAGNPNSLTLASDGTIYGTTYGTGPVLGQGAGAVFELTPPASPGGRWNYTVLKDFGGYHPDSPLILRNGNLYGAVASPSGGVVFELQPPAMPGGTWTTTYLHQFTNGQVPWQSLVLHKDGTLYGATAVLYQPPMGAGTVYAVSTKWPRGSVDFPNNCERLGR